MSLIFPNPYYFQEFDTVDTPIEGLAMFRNTDVHDSTGKLSLTVGNPSKTSENIDLFDNDFSADEIDPLSIAKGDQVGHGQLCVPGSLSRASGENFWPLDVKRTKNSLAQSSDSTEDSNCRPQP